MRVAFMGTPDFAAASLEALLASRHRVVAVVSQPDRRAGRGNRVVSPPVARIARERGLPLTQPETLRTDAFVDWLAGHEPEVIVVAAFGHILRSEVLGLPPRGCLNVHASLLPRWRGASPIQAAILAGDRETGVTIMRMDEGLDTGDVLREAAIPVRPDATGASLHDALADLGGRLLVETLDDLEAGEVEATPQDAAAATYAPMLRKRDGDLDWSRSAGEIERRVRAMHPWPGTRTRHRPDGGDARFLKIHPPTEVLPAGAAAEPGVVLATGPSGVDVACGEGTALRLKRLQAPGRRALDAEAFLAGYPLEPGSRLE
ncbi:MAG: methionyl-tRNA formyltransferase [Myxococcota bacterium]